MEGAGDLHLSGLRELHRLSLLKGETDSLFREYLAVGCDLLGLSVGIISRIREQDYEVLAVQAPSPAIRKGDHYALGDTYCSAVIRKQGSVALHHVGALEEMRSHPVYVGMQLESYIGTPVRVQGEVFGTLNFSATQPRPEPFGVEALEFIELMAQSLGHSLERNLLEQQRTLAVDELETNMALFEGAFRHAAIGMAIVAPNGRWLRVNQAVSDIVGYSADELLTIDFQTITHPEDLEEDLQHVEALLRGDGNHYRMKKRYTHRNGEQVWVLLAVSLVRNRDGTPRYFLSQIEDITAQVNGELTLREQRAELEELNRELAELARQDALSGLANRPVLMQRLQQALGSATRTREPLSVVRLDLDNLASINAEHGHLAGDEALVAVASALRKVAAHSATLSRFSGKQFLMLLPGAGLSQAEGLVADYRDAVLALDTPCPLAVSVGVATLMPCDEDSEVVGLDALLEALATAREAARHDGSNATRTVTL